MPYFNRHPFLIKQSEIRYVDQLVTSFTKVWTTAPDLPGHLSQYIINVTGDRAKKAIPLIIQ
jgi:hypothetical protein